MAGARTFRCHNAAVSVLTVLPVWVIGADCMLWWLRPACAMVAGHVCGVVSSVLAVVKVAVVH
jgi:hypothetical protein